MFWDEGLNPITMKASMKNTWTPAKGDPVSVGSLDPRLYAHNHDHVHYELNPFTKTITDGKKYRQVLRDQEDPGQKRNMAIIDEHESVFDQRLSRGIWW